MIQRLLGFLATSAIVATSSAQIYFDHGNAILVPRSSVARAGHFHTSYLNNLSKPMMPHVSDSGGIRPMGNIAIAGYYPADLRAAYRMPSNGGTGTIVIVDAYHDPSALSDFNAFSAQFGLPKETSTNATLSTNKVFQVAYSAGTQPIDAPLPNGWASETSLDIEWAHSLAPNAKILLVETADDTTLEQGVDYAKVLAGIHQISMSWGSSPEDNTVTVPDPVYLQNGVTFFAAAGDTSNEHDQPALYPNVVGVGGTSLNMSNGVVTSETAWNSSGGGLSIYVPRPSYQNGIVSIVGSLRGGPDISALGDPNTGVAVLSTYGDGGWVVFGGTSLATPICSAIANVRGAYSASSTAENTRNYANLGGPSFRDITSGVDGIYTAKVGWDFITGCGSPVGLLPSTQANPTTVSIANGSHTAGTVSSLYNQDGNTYNTLSSPFSTSEGEVAGDYILVHFGSAPSAYSKIYFYVNAATTATATTEVWAYNYTTGVYSLFGTIATSSTPQTKIYTLNTGPAASYFDSNHTVHLYLKSHTPGNNTTAHTLQLDQVVGYGLP